MIFTISRITRIANNRDFLPKTLLGRRAGEPPRRSSHSDEDTNSESLLSINKSLQFQCVIFFVDSISSYPSALGGQW